MPAAIECRDLRKTYDGKVEAVRGLNLEIQAGECFGLLGPNGAGKTTTIEILEGLLDPTSGEVTIFGRAWQNNSREMREWLGISLQETRLSEKLTVRETIELFASFYREPRSSEEVLDDLQLGEKADAFVGKLSGGQRQRLAVATALVGNPKILFLDEPTTGLDPQSRRQLWDIIRNFQRAGGTVLLTTHYMDEAERLCDRLVIVDHGQVIAEGTPPDLIERLGGHHVVEFEVSDNVVGTNETAPELRTAVTVSFGQHGPALARSQSSLSSGASSAGDPPATGSRPGPARQSRRSRLRLQSRPRNLERCRPRPAAPPRSQI